MSDCLCIIFLLCSFTFTVGVLCCFIFTFSLRLAVQYWDWLHKISLRLLCASSLEWQVEQVAVNCNSTCICVCAAECKLVPDTASFLGSQGWLSSTSVLCLYSVYQCWKVLVFHFPRVGCLYITFPPSPYYGSIYNQMLAWATKRYRPTFLSHYTFSSFWYCSVTWSTVCTKAHWAQFLVTLPINHSSQLLNS